MITLCVFEKGRFSSHSGKILIIMPQKFIKFGPARDSSVKNVMFMYSLWKQKEARLEKQD